MKQYDFASAAKNSYSGQQAESLKNSYVSKITDGFDGNHSSKRTSVNTSVSGNKVGEAMDVQRSKYAGSDTGTIYGANVDTAGKKSRDLGTPGLEQVGTQTKKSVGRNPFAS